ncbi:ribonuclease J [Clostridium cellulovorans]|uniref:Ribonuclease J n=1 Tax=Clostridium cellulovorans (strain ATCC 35296 / DSM 3052 / OCM 3 / 743B) TaxID=573061 RepID=D9SL63_CLOC7|nr:ribonuclease J [Clostridium cellulovorans]ADL51579.1 RNA-metabolising metallo-beta-lactamase [Clostridium cellulovorans 743B]
MRKEKSSEKSKIKIIPLGGISEIGKNMTLIEYKDELIIVDCGLKFPEDEMFGIDLVIPDITYLLKNKDRIKGIFLTHGHEDHIGALPYILKQINIPVYGTKLTLGIVETKLKEHNLLSTVELIKVASKDIVKLDKISVEFIGVSHSIADACSIAIHTPLGVILHTGDFKIDFTPTRKVFPDLARFAELGRKGVLCMLADSTNVERPGYTKSESVVGETFMNIFSKAKGRIIVATFASNVHRIQQIINSAERYGKKVAVSGRSLENVTGVALELGYLTAEEDTLVSVDAINRYNDDKVVIVTTGSQGEPMSALSRMAYNEHRKLNIKSGDTVILSASPIPGNERLVSRVINQLFRKGADVIYSGIAEVHVSGHACQEELKLMHTLVKPKHFVPAHGEYRHLKKHCELAVELGLDPNRTLIPELGDIIEVSRDGIKRNGTVVCGQVFVDGLGVGDVGNIVLRDRKHLSQDGILTVVVTIEKSSGSVIAGPDIISRGFVYVRESEDLMDRARAIVKEVLQKCEEDNITEWSTIKGNIKEALRVYLYEKTKRKPMILPIIMEI